MRLHVALYYPWIYLMSGGERILVELTARSRHRWTLYTNRFERAQTFPELLDREVVELNPVSVRRSLAPAGQAALRILTQRLPLEGKDALVVLCEGLGDLAVFRNGGLPRICLCMTPLRIAFDPGYREHYLGRRSVLEGALVRTAAAAFRALDRRAWRHYDHVFCISEEVRRRILEGGLSDGAGLEVVHVGTGVRPDGCTPMVGDYFLAPGRIMWTKHLELAILAFREYARQRPADGPARLVIAGLVDAKSRPYHRTLLELAAGDPAIEFQEAPSDARLRELYRGCHSVLFTAFNEDWGIVPLEAMAFQKPVIACNRGGPRETILHGFTGFLEEPTPEAFAARMLELARDPEQALSIGRRGPDRVAAFSWERFVERMDDQIEELVGSRRAGKAAGGRPGSVPAASGGA